MPDEVPDERVALLAAAARVPLSAESVARVARAVASTISRYACENITLPMETEPSTFVVVQHKDADR